MAPLFRLSSDLGSFVFIRPQPKGPNFCINVQRTAIFSRILREAGEAVMKTYSSMYFHPIIWLFERKTVFIWLISKYPTWQFYSYQSRDFNPIKCNVIDTYLTCTWFAMIDYHSYMAVLIGQGEHINSNFRMIRTILNRDMHIICRKGKI